MNLRSEQLAQHLGKPLAPIYIVSGDEPLQCAECCDQIRNAARQQGYTEREIMHVDSTFDWVQLNMSANSLSLFAEKRVIDLRMPKAKPGDKGAKALIAYAENPPDDTILLISSAKIDKASQRSKWFSALDKCGVVIQIWPVGAAQLSAWIHKRMRQRGLQAEGEAIALITDRVEGNLLAAAQEVDKLLLLHGEGRVTTDAVMASVADSARYDIYSLVDAALCGDAKKALKMLNGLRAEGSEAVLVLWALTREIRSLYAMLVQIDSGLSIDAAIARARVWANRKAMVAGALKRLNRRKLQQLLLLSADVDLAIKGYIDMDIWQGLLKLVLNLSGRPLFSRSLTALV